MMSRPILGVSKGTEAGFAQGHGRIAQRGEIFGVRERQHETASALRLLEATAGLAAGIANDQHDSVGNSTQQPFRSLLQEVSHQDRVGNTWRAKMAYGLSPGMRRSRWCR